MLPLRLIALMAEVLSLTLWGKAETIQLQRSSFKRLMEVAGFSTRQCHTNMPEQSMVESVIVVTTLSPAPALP
jgi:hypothetical protein